MSKPLNLGSAELNEAFSSVKSGQLVLLYGLPACGKTSLGAFLAYRLAQTQTTSVGYISAQEDMNHLYRRFVGIQTGLGNLSFRQLAKHVDLLDKAYVSLRRLPLELIDTDLERTLERLKTYGKPDLLATSGVWQQLVFVVDDLRSLAGETPTWALEQFRTIARSTQATIFVLAGCNRLDNDITDEGETLPTRLQLPFRFDADLEIAMHTVFNETRDVGNVTLSFRPPHHAEKSFKAMFLTETRKFVRFTPT